MRYLTPVLFAAAVASLLSTAPAHADTVGFTWEAFPGCPGCEPLGCCDPNGETDYNDFWQTLTNDSTSADIVWFEITIGDTAYNYDHSNEEVHSAELKFVLVTPDAVNGGVRSDNVVYETAGFAPQGF